MASTRDSRARVYGELRVSQYIIELTHEVDTIDGPQPTSAYYPTETSLHIGIGWQMGRMAFRAAAHELGRCAEARRLAPGGHHVHNASWHEGALQKALATQWWC